jgi:hypothetical protein
VILSITAVRTATCLSLQRIALISANGIHVNSTPKEEVTIACSSQTLLT